MSEKPIDTPAETPKRVTGVGGIFFKCKDPEAMKHWYHAHLGLQVGQWGTTFETRQADHPERKSLLQWCTFRENSKKFDPSKKDFMINYRVENLDWLIGMLREEGVQVLGEVEKYDYGKFCQIMDPEGNKIELWEPNDETYDKMVEGRTK